MCGIAGIFERAGGAVDEALLRAMADSMSHRGPDDVGVQVTGPCGLAHRRLSIRDLSPAGHQPLSDAGGVVTVSFNGEIYNDGPLRAELEREHGVRFRGTSDTELLPYGWLHWGERLFERLLGMFAIALWDTRTQELVLARDAIGIKPIYVHASADRVVFGSELKAVLRHPRVRRSIDPSALHTFLAAGHAGPDRSLVAGVTQVPPGTLVRYTARDEARRTYWAPRRPATIRDPREAAERFDAIWPEVVQQHLISDVPLGILQSGGIDSTLVSLALKGHGGIPCYTAGFREKSHDETDLARMVADAAGHELRVVSADDADDPASASRLLESIAHHTDGQCADTSAIALHRVAGVVAQHGKVVLSGDGGDEFFGGYDTYRATRMARRIGRLVPSALWHAAGRLAYSAAGRSEARLPAAAVAARFALGLAAGRPHAHVQWRRLVPDFAIGRLYGSALHGVASADPLGAYGALIDQAEGDYLDRCMVADQRFHLQSILAKVDTMSMAHSLEVRVPLLDRRVMELAGECHASLLCPPGGPQKRLLREAAARWGAPAAVVAEGKRGFNTPIAALLRETFRASADRVLDAEAGRLEPWLRADGVRELWRAHRDRRANHGYALWPILVLGTWLGLAERSGGPITQ